MSDMGFVTAPQRGSPLIPAVSVTGETMLLGYIRVLKVDGS